MKTKIKQELVTNRHYLIMSFVISALTILPQIFFSPSFEHSFFLCLTFVLLMSISKFSRIVFAILILFINMTNMIVGHIAMHWGYANADISPRIEALVLSPTYEMLEYLTTSMNYKDLLLGGYTIVVIYLLFKFIIHFTHSFKVVKVMGLSLFIILLIGFRLYYDPLKNVEPFSIPRKYMKISGDSEFKESIIQRKKYIKSVKYLLDESVIPIYDKVVIVMGESVNKHHMGIYGYSINTTPFLSSLFKSNDLYRFNAIAPTNQTRYSVPITLTKAHVKNFFGLYTNSISIVSVFRKNSYATYWISNQGKSGKYDDLITAIAEEANIQIFANYKFTEAKTDDVVLNYLETIKNSSLKEMYVIHLTGSHQGYTHRYNSKVSLFKRPTNTVEEYDNTIFFTDNILKSIFAYFKDEKFLLVYISDHGEVVTNEESGHGYIPAYKDEYEIPFVVYSSIENPRIEIMYEENKKHYFNTENFNYFIDYISGLSNDKNISFSSQVFCLEPKNITDYEKLEYYK